MALFLEVDDLSIRSSRNHPNRLANPVLRERNAAKPVCRQAGFILFDKKFIFVAVATGINFSLSST